MNVGTDIALNDFDISLIYGDFAVVSGQDAFLQQIVHRLQIPKSSYFYDKEFGSRLYEFLHANVDGYVLIDYKMAIREALENDPVVKNDSVEVEVSFENGELKAKVRFETLDDTPYNLVVSAGKELKIWEE